MKKISLKSMKVFGIIISSLTMAALDIQMELDMKENTMKE